MQKAWVKIVSALTPSCSEVTRLISESRERRLSRWERRRLKWHYRICRWCKRYGLQLDTLGKAMRQAGGSGFSTVELSSEARARLSKKLASSAADAEDPQEPPKT